MTDEIAFAICPKHGRIPASFRPGMKGWKRMIGHILTFWAPVVYYDLDDGIRCSVCNRICRAESTTEVN